MEAAKCGRLIAVCQDGAFKAIKTKVELARFLGDIGNLALLSLLKVKEENIANCK